MNVERVWVLYGSGIAALLALFHAYAHNPIAIYFLVCTLVGVIAITGLKWNGNIGCGNHGYCNWGCLNHGNCNVGCFNKGHRRIGCHPECIVCRTHPCQCCEECNSLQYWNENAERLRRKEQARREYEAKWRKEHPTEPWRPLPIPRC